MFQNADTESTQIKELLARFSPAERLGKVHEFNAAGNI